MLYWESKKYLSFLLVPGCAGMLLFSVLLYQELKGTIHLTKPPAAALLEDRYGEFLAEFSGADPSDELGY